MLYNTNMGYHLLNKSISPEQRGQTLAEQCTQVADTNIYTNALEEASRQHTEIIFGMFIANFLMIFTGRILTREDPFKIDFMGKELYRFNIDINKRRVARLDRILFGFNFMLISFLFILQFVDYGYFTAEVIYN